MDQESRLKKGRSLDTSMDLISELPRGVIDAILERLPLRDAARMSLLSRKWLEIWTSIHQLAFDAHFFGSVLQSNLHKTDEFSRIVSKILFHHEGDLLKFHLYVPSLKTYPDVNQWICYLSRTGVSDFNLHNQHRDPLQLSSHMFSCVHLEKLKLYHCVINPPLKFKGFRKMTTLELDRIAIREQAFRDLILSCPLLQKLRFTNFIGMMHIIINAPNLSHLIVDGTFISLDVRHASNLVSAFIGLQKSVKVCHRASLRVLVQALANSYKIEKLSFSGLFCKVLYKESLLPSVFERVRNLDFSSIQLNDLDDISSAITILQRCPSIVKLYISVSTSKNVTHVLNYDPCFVLHHLRCANVRVCGGSSIELKLIEFLLACSPQLETLSVTTIRRMTQSVWSRFVMQLIRFRRASTKVEVFCPEPRFSSIAHISDMDLSSSSENADASDSD